MFRYILAFKGFQFIQGVIGAVRVLAHNYGCLATNYDHNRQHLLLDTAQCEASADSYLIFTL